MLDITDRKNQDAGVDVDTNESKFHIMSNAILLRFGFLPKFALNLQINMRFGQLKLASHCFMEEVVI